MARIAIVLGEDFEDSEFRTPYDALCDAGHEIEILGIKAGEVHGKRGVETVELEAAASDRDPREFDAVVIPGGSSPEHLRTDKGVVAFVHQMVEDGKVVAAVCHGPQLLIEADGVKGKQLTSWPTVKDELVNAGARWVDRDVVIDGTLITSRKPADLPAFATAINNALAKPIEAR
jgi:protease I